MSESQNIEYKESWRDEYLKWVCGFANAQGGTIYIGIKVKPSTFPISYHGEFHYRSGTTKQQLTGIALSEFIMQKTGFRWEDVTVDHIKVEDLDDESFKIFRREALRSKRMTEADLNISNEELLSKLKLLSTADKIVDLIYLKYLKAKITYEHDRRVETYPFARNAIREAIYNAIAHNCYMYGTPIQIRIEEEQIIISNRCILPDGWTVETLMQPHDSIPYNPDIANVFYRAGYIETWGQGIQKICDECIALGAELPRYEILGTGIRVYFPALKSALTEELKTSNRQDVGKDVGLEVGLAEMIIALISEKSDVTMAEMAERLGVTTRTIEREMKKLRESERVLRVGGKRYGRWEVR